MGYAQRDKVVGVAVHGDGTPGKLLSWDRIPREVSQEMWRGRESWWEWYWGESIAHLAVDL